MADLLDRYGAFKRTKRAYEEALMGGSPAEIDDAERAYHVASLAYLEVVEPTHA
jgi:hypothetical protein